MKIQKYFTPKVVFHPNPILKKHYFVTYKPHLSLTEVTWTYLGSEGFFERYHFLYQVDFEISKKKFTPVTCPIWGHVFGSEKSKKSNPQSRFPSKHDFQKSSFCSNVPYTFIYTLLLADNRTTRHLCKRYY